MKNMFKMAAILAVFCAISAGSLSFVYLSTRPQIELYARTALQNSLREVLPGADSFIEKKGIYFGSRKGEQIGYAVPVGQRGYSSEIKLLVGINIKGRTVGLKVLNQNETPGLGVNILKPAFLKQFYDKTVTDPLIPKKDIDAITGATISTRAVCDGVRQALRLLSREGESK